MKNLRRTCAATILTLALTASTFAGQIDCPGAPAPGVTQGPGIAVTVVLTVLSLIR
jgi:hypothetical protein